MNFGTQTHHYICTDAGSLERNQEGHWGEKKKVSPNRELVSDGKR